LNENLYKTAQNRRSVNKDIALSNNHRNQKFCQE
jgi:hypothetical protein